MTAVRDNANAKSAAKPVADWDLERLVRKHQVELWRYARFLGASASQADDLVQEAFLAVHRKPFEQRGDAQSSAYLRTVIRRCLLMARRREDRQVETASSAKAMEQAEQVWARCAAGEQWDQYKNALDQCLELLGGRVRDSLNLFYQDQLSRQQIAARLTMTPDGVKTMLRRARKKLQDCVQRKVQP